MQQAVDVGQWRITDDTWYFALAPEIGVVLPVRPPLGSTARSNEDTMKIKFYGTRGSIPVPDREFMDFGGNTSCVRVTWLRAKSSSSTPALESGSSAKT